MNREGVYICKIANIVMVGKNLIIINLYIKLDNVMKNNAKIKILIAHFGIQNLTE